MSSVRPSLCCALLSWVGCDLGRQDDDIFLCGSDGVVDSQTSVCTPLDESNNYYAWFSDECGVDEYPACVCEVRGSHDTTAK